MQTMATHRAVSQTIRLAPVATPAPMARRPMPETARPRVIRALLWLLRRLFVEPVGRKAREERLLTLGPRYLRDIGLERIDMHASAWGGVPMDHVTPEYPSPGPLFICGRPGFPLTVVRLGKAA
jgi:hypothetical protein